jgi:hypothetical protein
MLLVVAHAGSAMVQAPFVIENRSYYAHIVGDISIDHNPARSRSLTTDGRTSRFWLLLNRSINILSGTKANHGKTGHLPLLYVPLQFAGRPPTNPTVEAIPGNGRYHPRPRTAFVKSSAGRVMEGKTRSMRRLPNLKRCKA